MNEEDDDDKKTEKPLGKDAEANLFKSRSIFIYGGITQELASAFARSSLLLLQPATKTSRFSSTRRADMSNRVTRSMT